MRLITWNVQWFCGLDERIDMPRIVSEAQAMADFDVLCLQEVAVNYPRLTGDAGFDQVARLRQLLPGYELVFGAAVTELGRQGQRQQFGNLIACRQRPPSERARRWLCLRWFWRWMMMTEKR